MKEQSDAARSEMPFYIVSLAIIFCRLSAAYVFSTFDDAFITYRYAENLAHGFGLVYNPHEKVLGTTAPLFAVVCAIPVFLTLSIPKFVLFFNIGCDIISYRIISKQLFGKRAATALIFGLLFAIDPAVNRISIGGMEANLFFLGSVYAIVLFDRGRRYPAYAIAAVVYFLRPEAVILFGLFLIFDWRRGKKFPLKAPGLGVAVAALPLLFIFLFYGHLLPQSVIAKNQQGVNPFSGLVKNIFFSTPVSFVIFPLAVFGGYLAFHFRIAFKIIIVWIAVYAGAYLIRGPWILNWYIYSIAAGELILASIALEKIMSALRLSVPANGFSSMGALGAIALWFFVGFRFGRSGVETNVFSELRQDFGNGSAGNKVFFADDIGALGFYTHGYIYDDLMLVTPQAILYPDAGERIAHLKPDYLFLYSNKYYLSLIAGDSGIRQHYQFIKRYSKSGATQLPVLDSADTVYRQDFMLLKRKEPD